MKKLIHDERSLEQKRIIESELFLIIMGILLASMVIKIYNLNTGWSGIILEGICFLVAVVYYVSRSFSLGHSFYSKHFSFKSILLCSLGSSILCFISSGYSTLYQFASVFFIIFGFIFISNSILYLLNKNKQKKLEMEMDFDDSE